MKEVQYALFKRALEYFEADPAFRKSMKEDPDGTALFMGLPAADGKAVYEAIDTILFHQVSRQTDQPYTRAWLEAYKPRFDFCFRSMRKERYRDPAVYAAVSTALERERMESLEMHENPQFRFVPLAYELSRGCQVQCSFCGLDAEIWKEDFTYQENASLWQNILRSAKDVLGDIADQAPLYFATEPLDHPDYLRFLKDVEALGGYIPQTTTAAAERSVKKTRELMAFIGERRCLNEARLRFSVRSLSHFQRIMKAFSPEELVGVELILNNPESVHMISPSGRVREKSSYGERVHAEYSISCLCGVKVNLCESSLTYMEPEIPDDASPLGIRVRERAFFTDAASFETELRRLYARYAIASPGRNRPLTWNRHIQILREPDRIVLSGKGAGYYLARNLFTDYLAEAFTVGKPGCSAGELVSRMRLSGQAEQRLLDLVDVLFQKGYLIITS